MRKYTTMRITNVTKERLRDLAYTQGEPFENIVIRLLESKCGASEVFYMIRSKDEEFQLKISVDWGELSENLYFYNEHNQKFTHPPVLKFDDEGKKERYAAFVEKINDIPNIHAMLMILSEGQFIRAGELIIERL